MNGISLKQITRRRTYLGLLIVLGGLAITVVSVLHALAGSSHMGPALSSSGTAAVTTTLGTLPRLLVEKPSLQVPVAMRGFGAGVMLSIVLIPSICLA